MGLNFKGLKKAALKIGGKIAKEALASTPIGGAVLRAQTALKGLGVSLKAAKARPEPVSVQAGIEKHLAAGAKKKLAPMPTTRTALPGGAPIRKPSPRRRPAPASVPSGSRRKPSRRVAKGPASPARRKPPTGGLDLKALSASWKAAGKPGKWIDWVKANR